MKVLYTERDRETERVGEKERERGVRETERFRGHDAWLQWLVPQIMGRKVT